MADRHVRGLAHLVHHEARLEGRHLAPQRRATAVVALHRGQEVGGVRIPCAFFGSRAESMSSRTAGSGPGAEPPVERALDEAVAVLDRRRLRHHRQQRDVGDQEEVDDVVRRARPQVDEHDVHVERAELVEDAHLLLVVDVGRPQHVGGAADQAQAGGRRVHHHVLDALDPPLDEVAERARRRGQAQARVQVRAAEVGVDEDDPRPMRASCHPSEAASSDLPIPPLPPPMDQIWRRVVLAEMPGRTSDTLRAISSSPRPK